MSIRAKLVTPGGYGIPGRFEYVAWTLPNVGDEITLRVVSTPWGSGLVRETVRARVVEIGRGNVIPITAVDLEE